MRIILSLIKINRIRYSLLRTNTNHNCPRQIRSTTKIIIINNLIILIYNFEISLNIYILIFSILINIHLYRYLSIYYQLVVIFNIISHLCI